MEYVFPEHAVNIGSVDKVGLQIIRFIASLAKDVIQVSSREQRVYLRREA